jgi:hypothetical protein
MPYNAANPFAPPGATEYVPLPLERYVPEGYFPGADAERLRKKREAEEAMAAHQARMKSAGAAGAAAAVSGQAPPPPPPSAGPFSMEGAARSLEDLPGGPSDVSPNVEGARSARAPIRAVNVDGKVVFTNQPDIGGQEMDYGQATQDFREAGAGRQIYSPYERYNPPTGLGTQLGGAVTRAEPGGYVFGGGELDEEGRTKWENVANPQAFEAFAEEPMENIMARRAADLAKSQALQEDPFAEKRMELDAARIQAEADRYRAEKGVEAAGVEGRQAREFTLADQAYLSQQEDEIRRKLNMDPKFRALPPHAQEEVVQVQLDKALSAFRNARARMTQREDIFNMPYRSSAGEMP